MIKYLTATELGRCLGVKPGIVSMAITRGELKKDEDKKIDMEDPLTRLWLHKQETKMGRTIDWNRLGGVKAIQSNTVKAPVQSKKSSAVVVAPVEVELDEATKLSVRKARVEIERIESVTHLNNIKLEKAKGELIPMDEASTIMTYIVEEIRSTYQQEVDGLVNVYKDRLDLTHAQYLDIKQTLKDIINTTTKDAVDKMRENVDGVQKKYSEVVDRGNAKL
jgi:hypothetical protein